MKYNKLTLSVLITVLFHFGCQNQTLYAQSTVSVNPGLKGFYIGAGTGYALTQIRNDFTQEDPAISMNFRTRPLVNVEIGHFFSENFGLVTGLSYSSYGSQTVISDYNSKIQTVDIENDTYELTIEGSDIEEKEEIQVLGVPVSFIYHSAISNKTGFFLMTGVNLSVPLRERYENSGVFTCRGYFPDYNVTLENLPEYGFPKDLKIESDGNLLVKRINYMVHFVGGFDFFLSNSVQIAVSAFYERSISNISDYSVSQDFRILQDQQINSIMSGSRKTNLQSFGVKLGIRYYLGKHDDFSNISDQTSKKNLKVYLRNKKKYFN